MLCIYVALGVGGGYEWNTFVHVSLRLESCSQKALEKQCLFRGSLCFQLIVLVSNKRLYKAFIRKQPSKQNYINVYRCK